MAGKMLTIKQLLGRYPYSDRDIRRKLQKGKIKAIKPEGKWLIPEDEVQRLLGEQGPTKSPPLGEFVDLLQQWQEQVQFLSVDQLLYRFCFQNRHVDRQREVTEPEEVSEAYFDAYGRHWGTIPKPYKAMLPVETDNSFQQLKKSHPDAELWQAQESWDKAYGIYWDAFASFVVELEYTTELLMGLGVEEGTSGDLGSKIVNARELIKKTKRAKSDVWLFLRLLALAVACDLLILGIQEQSPQAFWALEVEKIRKLRSATVLASMNELPQHFWITGTNRDYPVAKSLWDNDQPVKEKTMALLEALERLQSAQSDVHNEFKKLETEFI